MQKYAFSLKLLNFWGFWGAFKINFKTVAITLKLIVASSKPNSYETRSDIYHSRLSGNHKIMSYLQFSLRTSTICELFLDTEIYTHNSHNYSYINNKNY